jgi:suppressor for copper-sensitivity B
LLAAALVALKLGGATVGWGIQFQQPAFLIFMALVLTLFTANLWGWLEFRLPGRVAAAAGGPARAPDEETALGAFLSGAFATLLATPCSAPFVGAAVGFALARGPLEIVAVFLTLGLGLALPYLAVALFPAIAAHLPRPGRWMLHLRAVLGAALLVTAAWLLSVLDAQMGAAASGATAGLLLILLALLWSMHDAEGVRRGISLAGAAVLVGLTFLTPLRFVRDAGPTAVSSDKELVGPWRKFDLAAIGTLVEQGHVVFVDVTADWCITCQVNKAAVLARGDVAQHLAEGNVVPMRADWTRPDAAIAHYLASFGRYGIPFNVVYGPRAREGIPLPELLTSEAVLAALDKAQGPGQAQSHAQARP